MHGDEHPARVALRQARETTIEQLSDSFARDELSLEEFELRIDRAYAAADSSEVQSLVSDLSVAPVRPRIEAVVESAPTPLGAIVPAAMGQQLRRRGKPLAAVAIFGSIERRGRWALAPDSEALAVFGNIEIDLRSVALPAGVTELFVKAIFGNIEIIVPPALAVECHGVSMFGSFESLERVPIDPESGTILHVTGKAIFGNVEISTLPVNAQRGAAALARWKK